MENCHIRLSVPKNLINNCSGSFMLESLLAFPLIQQAISPHPVASLVQALGLWEVDSKANSTTYCTVFLHVPEGGHCATALHSRLNGAEVKAM